MERVNQSPEVYDFRQHDRIWRRVNPALEPYPETAAVAVPRPAALTAAPDQSAVVGMTAAQESQLPGAEPNPCCMGTEAAVLLNVLEGYIEEEWADRRWYLALSAQAPIWARQSLREMAEDEGGHARRLMAVYYLITGQSYRSGVVCDRIVTGDWRTALRQSYHEEVCGGLNYARTAEDTTDVCLAKLLNELSADEYRHADRLMAMLERSLGRQNGC